MVWPDLALEAITPFPQLTPSMTPHAEPLRAEWLTVTLKAPS